MQTTTNDRMKGRGLKKTKTHTWGVSARKETTLCSPNRNPNPNPKSLTLIVHPNRLSSLLVPGQAWAWACCAHATTIWSQADRLVPDFQLIPVRSKSSSLQAFQLVTPHRLHDQYIRGGPSDHAAWSRDRGRLTKSRLTMLLHTLVKQFNTVVNH